MVRREKQFDQPPATLSDPKWSNLKATCLAEGNKHQADSRCYRDAVFNALSIELYHYKCAYCERDRGDEIQVDHYRPKKARVKGDEKFRHPGYYWLAYEWSNLIPACAKCNQKKGNKFPLKGWAETNRIKRDPEYHPPLFPQDFDLRNLNRLERPLILNPEAETRPFRDHFAFNRKGQIVGRTDEANATIAILQLDRRDLRRLRKTIVNDTLDEIKNELFITTTNIKHFQTEILSWNNAYLLFSDV